MDTSTFRVSITHQKVGPTTETPSARDMIVALKSTAGIVCREHKELGKAHRTLEGTKKSGRHKKFSCLDAGGREDGKNDGNLKVEC